MNKRCLGRSPRSGWTRACVGCAAAALVGVAQGQVEPIFATFPGGPDGTRLIFPHLAAPGDAFTTFEFFGAATHADAGHSHVLVLVFEWRDLPTDPWSSSPDNVFSIIGGMPNPVMTGVFTTPHVPGEVALHVYNGLPGGMTLAGDFSHLSLAPAPASLAMLLAAGVVGHRHRR